MPPPGSASFIRCGHLPAGEVDTRSIAAVRREDLVGFDQCHFFAGIGGWPYALDLAGWGDRPVWTGSCPCQPFSAAGKRRGTADERHLWPEFHRLIAECRPSIVFGEQVASKDGRLWLTGVRADLEALGYGVGAADLCAAGIGAPHIRQRLFWLGDSQCEGLARRSRQRGDDEPQQPSTERTGGDAVWLADSQHAERGPVGSGNVATGVHDAWSAHEWIACLDGKARRTQPGLWPLADGVPARMGRLRGYGNAIVPQVAAEFIAVYLDAPAG